MQRYLTGFVRLLQKQISGAFQKCFDFFSGVSERSYRQIKCAKLKILHNIKQT